jgi:hypothetical protein
MPGGIGPGVWVRILEIVARDRVSFLEPGAQIDQLAALAAERTPPIVAPAALAFATRATDQYRHCDQ